LNDCLFSAKAEKEDINQIDKFMAWLKEAIKYLCRVGERALPRPGRSLVKRDPQIWQNHCHGI